MKRIVLLLGAGVLTFSMVYGLAASLNLTSNSLGAATTTVAACQSATLTATYTTSYTAATPGYTVGTVTVSGLTSGCYSHAYRITLTGAADASLGEATGTTPSSGTLLQCHVQPSRQRGDGSRRQRGDQRLVAAGWPDQGVTGPLTAAGQWPSLSLQTPPTCCVSSP